MAKTFRMPLLAILLTLVWVLFGNPKIAMAGPSCEQGVEGNFESHDPLCGYGHESCNGTPYFCRSETTYCKIGVNNCYWRCVMVDGQIQIQDVSCLQVFYGCPQPHPTCMTCGGDCPQ
jgi:hypothetical protein